jgi:hypothetical protein
MTNIEDDTRLTEGYGRPSYSRLPTTLDEDTVKAVGMVLRIGTQAEDEQGNARPLFMPPGIALQIVRALRGEHTSGAKPVPAAPGEER